MISRRWMWTQAQMSLDTSWALQVTVRRSPLALMQQGNRCLVIPPQIQRNTHQNPKEARSSVANVPSKYEPIALCLNDHRKTLSPTPKLSWSNSVCDYIQHKSPINAQKKATKFEPNTSNAVTRAANIENTGTCALFMTTLLGEPSYLNSAKEG